MTRLIVAAIVIAFVLTALFAASHWEDDRHPLMVDAAVTCPAWKVPHPCAAAKCGRMEIA